MADRGWILNASAIAAAKLCIQVVQNELGVKLKLSHPEFVELLSEYCDLTDSEELRQAYYKLMVFAGDEVKVVQLKTKNSSPMETNIASIPVPNSAKTDTVTTDKNDEMVTYQGKSYARFNSAGQEFKGLYRGGARYS